MDYKKILKDENIRFKILGFFDFIPDKLMIRLQYFIKFNRKLDLKTPKRFTEKIQFYKLYYRKELMTQCADKYNVRKYVKSKGYSDILIPLYGIYSDAEEINYDELPLQFILKTTNGSHTNIVCFDKNEFDFNMTNIILNKWLKRRTPKAGREWPYYNIEPKIICEKLLKSYSKEGLIDYKFVCFGGKVEYIFINAERYSDIAMKFGVYDKNFNHLPYKRRGLRDTDLNIKKPVNFDRMIDIAEDLSVDFPHARIDLYNLNGNIYFGEITFFHGSGYIQFEPDEFDFILGEKFLLSNMLEAKL